jgi:hypothetical protein
VKDKKEDGGNLDLIRPAKGKGVLRLYDEFFGHLSPLPPEHPF